jgi:hypothetical protein
MNRIHNLNSIHLQTQRKDQLFLQLIGLPLQKVLGILAQVQANLDGEQKAHQLDAHEAAAEECDGELDEIGFDHEDGEAGQLGIREGFDCGRVVQDGDELFYHLNRKKYYKYIKLMIMKFVKLIEKFAYQNSLNKYLQ